MARRVEDCRESRCVGVSRLSPGPVQLTNKRGCGRAVPLARWEQAVTVSSGTEASQKVRRQLSGTCRAVGGLHSTVSSGALPRWHPRRKAHSLKADYLVSTCAKPLLRSGPFLCDYAAAADILFIAYFGSSGNYFREQPMCTRNHLVDMLPSTEQLHHQDAVRAAFTGLGLNRAVGVTQFPPL